MTKTSTYLISSLMQWGVIILAIAIGLATVFQGALNRIATESFGMSIILVINNLVVFLLGLLLYFWIKNTNGFFPDFFQDKGQAATWSWLYVLPGMLGLLIVVGIPYAISRVGAVDVFVGIVCAQMVGSLLWDYYAEGMPVTTARLVGTGLTIAGVFFLKL